MSTIGDLERKAGIGTSPAERAEFWRQFHHLEGEACLSAGVADLRRLIAVREVVSDASPTRVARCRREVMPPLTADQQAALQAYAAKHGRRWKSILSNAWMGGPPHDDGGVLRVFATRTVRPGCNPTGCPSRPSGRRAFTPGAWERRSLRGSLSFPFDDVIFLPTPDCPSVLLRSEPAAVRFKAAVAPRCGRTPPSFTEQARVLRRGQLALFARKPAPLVQVGPDPEAPVFPPVRADRTEGQAGMGRSRFGRPRKERPWPSLHPLPVNPHASCNFARALPSKWSGLPAPTPARR